MRWGPFAYFALVAYAALHMTDAEAERLLSVRNGAQATFALRPAAGAVLMPGKVRVAPAGSVQPKPGEISIGVSTTQAVGAPKIHIYNAYSKAVRFTFVAMDDAKVLETDSLCGHLDTDSWVVLPERTARVVLSHFVALTADCP